MDDTVKKTTGTGVTDLSNTLIETADEGDPIQGTDPVSGADYDLDDQAEKMGLRKQDPEHPTPLNSLADEANNN